MTNTEIKNLPEGTNIKVYLPESIRDAWRGEMYINGTLAFQKIPKAIKDRFKALENKEWYLMSDEDQEFYEEWRDEKEFGIAYPQPFTKRFHQFTIKKGTECVCYQYECENFSTN